MDDRSLAQITPQSRRRAFRGAVIGHLIEWYDYGVYGFLAVYVGQVFFASADPTVGLLSSFAVFAVSFFLRPIGGLIFGPMGDRIGRKRVMLVVMVMMAASTMMIGVLPGYETIGLLAPALLVLARCLQGLSAGGETGTVTAFIAEYSTQGKRGYGTSYIMSTAVLGFLLGSLVANGLTAVIGEEAMQSGGWRVPFLIAAPLGLVALYIRIRLEDSPEFKELEARGETSEAPLREMLTWMRPIVIVFFFYGLHCAIFYLVLTYASTFLASPLEFGAATRFWFVTLGCVVSILVIPLGGLLSDRFGRRPFLLLTGLLSTGTMAWFFLAASSATPASFAMPFFATVLAFALFVSSTFATISELLPTRIRSTGVGVACNISAALFGGSAPFVAAWLISWTGSTAAPLWFFVTTGVLGLAAIYAIRPADFERAARDATLQDSSPRH